MSLSTLCIAKGVDYLIVYHHCSLQQYYFHQVLRSFCFVSNDYLKERQINLEYKTSFSGLISIEIKEILINKKSMRINYSWQNDTCDIFHWNNYLEKYNVYSSIPKLILVNDPKLFLVVVWKLKRNSTMKFLIGDNINAYNRFVKVEVMFANHVLSSIFQFHVNHYDVKHRVMD